MLNFLLSPQGQDLLAQLAQENLNDANSLSLITRLRKQYSAEESAAALTLAKLRLKAVTKFGEDANKLYFTEDALQQASDPQIRAYRSQNMAGLSILDICCGIGADSLAFAQAGAYVHGLDIDPERIAMAEANAAALNLSAQFSLSDVTKGIPSDADLIFFDPARRDEQGKRLFDVESYIPPLSLIRNWQAEAIMVKLSPAVALEQIAPYGGLVEFISVDGDLKEAVLYLGNAAGLKATLISDGQVHHWEKQSEEVSFSIEEPHGWLCEPDPSILRAGLVRDLALSVNARLLDETIAYFCTEQAESAVWYRAWKIREWLPFNLKKLRERLRSYDVGTLTVKKRGSPLAPEDLIRQLKLKGKQSATVVLTRYAGQAIVVICDDILIPLPKRS